MSEVMRDRVEEAVAAYPGIHLRGLVAHLGSSVALVRYHLQHLEAEGRVRRAEVGGFVRFFPPQVYKSMSRDERRMLNVLRQDRPLEIVLTLIEHGPLPHGHLLELVGGSKATLSYQLRKLEEAGVVATEGRGFAVARPDAVRRVLVQYEPVPEQDRAVHELWDRIFSG